MIVVFITFIIGLFVLSPKKKNHFFIGLILFICFLTEAIALVLKIQDKWHYIKLLYDISSFSFLATWLLILLNNFAIVEKGKWLLYLFILFALLNFFFIQGEDALNCYTYVFGSLIYIVVFSWKSISYIKNQNFSFLFSSTYILLIAPMALLYGLSFMFVFVDQSITSVKIYGDITLYSFVCTYVNAVFYGLLNIYMFKELRNQK